MLTIIDFFRKKGDFRRNFIFQCGINHTPFVTVLSFRREIPAFAGMTMMVGKFYQLVGKFSQIVG